MINKNGYLLTASLFSLIFMAACSKNLMPPEGLDGTTLSSQSEKSGKSGSSGSAGPGFLTEENVGESARSGEFQTRGPNGSGDRSEPFLDNPGSGFGAMSDQARKLPFKDTDYLKDIYFKFDKYDLDDESRQILRQNASYLKANSSAVVEVQGHCDERGTNNYNIALGERRAQSTKMYLVSQGVSSRQIHTISYGEERPSCFDTNSACWIKNRRAHFRLSE